MRPDELPTSALPENAHFYRYDNGRVVEEMGVRRGDPIFDKLITLLSSHINGWVADLNTYTPSLLFKSNDIDINCRNDVVVINLRKSGSDSWMQLSSPIKGCMRAIAGSRGEDKNRQ